MNVARRSRLGRSITILAIPFLILGCWPRWTPPVRGQENPAPQAPAPVAVAEPAATGTACGADAPAAPGQKVMLQGEDEINLAWRWKESSKALKNTTMDLANNALQPTTSAFTMDALSSVGWVDTVVADLNTDGIYEMVTVVKDKYKRLGVVSSAAPSVEWYADASGWAGDDLGWIDIAAGDLGRGAFPRDEEIVIAFHDTNEDLRVVVLNGNSTGGIGHSPNYLWGQWHDTSEARGSAHFIAVETGDFNGDGYDDEIAVAFKDSNNDLQVVFLRRDGTTLTKLWSKSWQDHNRGNVANDCSSWGNHRPIDITTGDIDGDMRDEAIVGFRAGATQTECWNGALQLLMLDSAVDTRATDTITDDVYSFDDRVWVDHPLHDHYSMAATSVSISAADLDGNGDDEIAVGYGTINTDGDHDNRAWQHLLVSYDFVPVTALDWAGCLDDSGQPRACLQQRTGKWRGDNVDIPAFVAADNPQVRVTIDTGDIDGDGYAEIALVRQEHSTGDVLTHLFDAESGISSPAVTYRYASGDNRMEEFWLGVGDRNGDSLYGTYTGVCTIKNAAQVTTVIHAPPLWPWGEEYSNAKFTEAGFGQSVGSSTGSGKTNTATLGGSVKLEGEYKHFGASFKTEWEHSWAVEHETLTTTVQGGSFSTVTPHESEENPYWDALQIIETHYWCYNYTEPSLGTMPVCLPYPTDRMASVTYSLKSWYTSKVSEYADSWVPVGLNLARGRPAVQSNTYSTAAAARAVDGNTNGSYSAGSVAHTDFGANSWWQVDLGGEEWINGVLLWNRTDGYAERLANAYVFVSNTPFPAGSTPDSLRAAGVWYSQLPATPIQRTVVSVNRHGRYVRVQLPGSNYLQLAEVEVYGMPATPHDWPILAPEKDTPADGLFRLTWPGGFTQDVPGKVMFIHTANPLGVRTEGGAQEVDLGIGEERNFITEGETAVKATVGLKVYFVETEFSAGVSVANSYSLGWNREIEFSGTVDGLEEAAPKTMEYDTHPYIWLQRAVSRDGTEQAFLVMDWWVPWINTAAVEDGELHSAGPAATGPALPAVQPAVPLISSPTHPDEGTWYASRSVGFTWAQPPGDPAAVTGYRWSIDHAPGTVPPPASAGLVNAATYEGVGDGVWYLHVRAGSGDQWSEPAHRRIQIDGSAPQVQLTLDPPLPTGNDTWYVTPVTAVVAASDGSGAGLTALEISTDGMSWLPYTAPVAFTTDTAATTIHARATDAAGHTSEPVTATFKLDQTAPNSHVAGGEGPGALVARIVTSPQGNQGLVLAGAVQDDLSGYAGMHIGIDGVDWTSAKELRPVSPVATTWFFTATRELGAGNHVFMGQAQDGAGNLEAPYEIARVLWAPQESPDLSGSSVTASPTTLRPGEEVTFALVARNGGFQEALVEIRDTLPAGLTIITDTLAADAAYDPASRTLVWPARLLWPGESARITFHASADAGLPAGTVQNQAAFHAFWPDTASLPADQRQPFLDHEKTLSKQSSIVIDPALPAGADVTPPWAGIALASAEQVVGVPEIMLAVDAAEDARWMFLREWKADPVTGAWTVAQESGWIDFSPTRAWTLSAGHGVKYVGVWVRDAAGNVSTLDEGSLFFVNRMDGSQSIGAGQRVQFRGNLEQGTTLSAQFTTVAGDPDLHAWRPANGFRPDLSAASTMPVGQVETLGEYSLERSGRFLLEVHAVGDSEYQISFEGHRPEAVSAASPAVKSLPAHPLTVSDPLTAGMAGTPDSALTLRTYIPLLFNYPGN